MQARLPACRLALLLLLVFFASTAPTAIVAAAMPQMSGMVSGASTPSMTIGCDACDDFLPRLADDFQSLIPVRR